MRTMKIKRTLAITGLSGVLLLAGACGSSDQTSTANPSTPGAPQSPGVGSAGDDSIACEMVIGAADQPELLATAIDSALTLAISEGGNGLRWQLEDMRATIASNDVRAAHFDAKRIARSCASLGVVP